VIGGSCFPFFFPPLVAHVTLGPSRTPPPSFESCFGPTTSPFLTGFFLDDRTPRGFPHLFRARPADVVVPFSFFRLFFPTQAGLYGFSFCPPFKPGSSFFFSLVRAFLIRKADYGGLLFAPPSLIIAPRRLFRRTSASRLSSARWSCPPFVPLATPLLLFFLLPSPEAFASSRRCPFRFCFLVYRNRGLAFKLFLTIRWDAFVCSVLLKRLRFLSPFFSLADFSPLGESHASHDFFSPRLSSPTIGFVGCFPPEFSSRRAVPGLTTTGFFFPVRRRNSRRPSGLFFATRQVAFPAFLQWRRCFLLPLGQLGPPFHTHPEELLLPCFCLLDSFSSSSRSTRWKGPPPPRSLPRRVF